MDVEMEDLLFIEYATRSHEQVNKNTTIHQNTHCMIQSQSKLKREANQETQL